MIAGYTTRGRRVYNYTRSTNGSTQLIARGYHTKDYYEAYCIFYARSHDELAANGPSELYQHYAQLRDLHWQEHEDRKNLRTNKWRALPFSVERILGIGKILSF